jgi:hypothetical protein
LNSTLIGSKLKKIILKYFDEFGSKIANIFVIINIPDLEILPEKQNNGK